jgi:hypothetical protein
MMEETGLNVGYIFGDYSGSSLTENSERMIVIGEKI